MLGSLALPDEGVVGAGEAALDGGAGGRGAGSAARGGGEEAGAHGVCAVSGVGGGGEILVTFGRRSAVVKIEVRCGTGIRSWSSVSGNRWW